MIKFNEDRNAYQEYSRSQFSCDSCIDMHNVIKSGNLPAIANIEASELKNSLDVRSWLPFAAESYNISAKLEDYVITPVTIFYSDLPNSNLAAFPYSELTAWNAQAGNIAYKTWKAKPTFVEHANHDHTKAKGIILDTALRKAEEYAGDLYRMILLAGWDRSRDPDLANKVSGPAGFSMGAWVNDYTCSICAASLRNGGCKHITPRRGITQQVVGNNLTYRIAHGVTGFELSLVQVPAFRQAVAKPIG